MEELLYRVVLVVVVVVVVVGLRIGEGLKD